jgi:hypothetical protein
LGNLFDIRSGYDDNADRAGESASPPLEWDVSNLDGMKGKYRSFSFKIKCQWYIKYGWGSRASSTED